MTAAADLVLTNAEVHSLAEPDETAEAMAIRDGTIVRVDKEYEVNFLVGIDTDVIDLEGRVVIPGFVDAHTHMEQFGQYLVHADLSAVASLDEALSRLQQEAEPGDESDRDWVFGFGWDESNWPENRYLQKEDLDRVSDERPIAAVRVDMHLAALNSVALERLRAEMPDDDVRTENGEPTGVVVEDAVEPVRDAVASDPAETRKLLTAARDAAHELGVTGVHDKVRDSHAPRVYRELDDSDELGLRVRIDYWSDHLDAALETGLRTNHGSEMVRVGGIKSFTDGSIGGRTAKLSEPFADDPEETGKWVVDPNDLRDLVDRADREGFQLTVHAIGDEATRETVAVFENCDNPEGARHRVEHAELVDQDVLVRMAEAGIVASCQPNFLKWAGEESLYQDRLGEDRRRRSNALRELLEAGVPLAFGSDCMPLDPLLGVYHAVNAPDERQQLSVTEALRAYTKGSAYAGFDESRLGTIEEGKLADLVALERSPWEHPNAIEDIDVTLTVVDGEVVHDARPQGW
ncbi:MAG: putative amidohydrolase YtcJ [Halobacteriales archaeon]|jgi:predicted amidohydrolase YtcJ